MSRSLQIPMLFLVLMLAVLFAISTGVLPISIQSSLGVIGHQFNWNWGVFTPAQETVLIAIRMPRVLMAVLVGAALASAGAVLQSLFRNPLADPALIGLPSGAMTAAAIWIVLGSSIPLFEKINSAWILPLVTFFGALISVYIVYLLAKSKQKLSVSIVLLAGIAMNSFATTITGFLIYWTNDDQLRDLIFWSMGSLGGSNWSSVAGLFPFVMISIFVLFFYRKELDIIVLGEQNAELLGINTSRMKKIVLIAVALSVGASVAFTGMIGFIGLVVPHIIRMWIGPSQGNLLIASVLGGALLLVLSDCGSRMFMAPTELPIGIITGLFGAPFFLFLLLKDKKQKVL